MEPPVTRDTHLALLELKTSALERRFDAWRRDLLIFIATGLVAFPLGLHQIEPIARHGAALPLSVVAALLLVGIPAWRRDRREARAEAQRRQRIYLSLRPDVFGP